MADRWRGAVRRFGTAAFGVLLAWSVTIGMADGNYAHQPLLHEVEQTLVDSIDCELLDLVAGPAQRGALSPEDWQRERDFRRAWDTLDC